MWRCCVHHPVRRMWDITRSSFGSEGGYPKLSFSPLFRRESIIILLQISPGICLSLPIKLSTSSTFQSVFPVSWPWTRQLCGVESLHPPEYHVTPSVHTDTIKDTRVARVSDRTCLNKQKQKICYLMNTHGNQSESRYVSACVSSGLCLFLGSFTEAVWTVL